MKKIGIITFHRANNYGAVLQNFALLSTINSLNSECLVNTVDFRNDFLEEAYKNNPFNIKSKNFLKNIYFKLRYLLINKKFNNLRCNFDFFRSNYLNLSKSYNSNNYHSIDEDFDVLITGSDQVWNGTVIGEDNEGIYSLGNFKDVFKVSYAASAGSNKFITQNIVENIKNIDNISVREEDLKLFLEKQIYKNISLVLDPVFLLSKDEWNDKLKRERIVKDKYIFVYSVSEKFPVVLRIAKKLAKEMKCKIVHVDNSLKYGIYGVNKYGASPLEFVQLIRDSEMVIASSFHAIAFSIIFGKKLITVPTDKTRSRIDNILSLSGLTRNCFSNYEDFEKKGYTIEQIDYDLLDKSKIASLDFLKKSFK